MTVTTGTNPKNRGFIREKSLKKTHKSGKTERRCVWKFTSPGTAGVPDRIVLMPVGLGKTITTLTAIHNLMFDLFVVRRV